MPGGSFRPTAALPLSGGLPLLRLSVDRVSVDRVSVDRVSVHRVSVHRVSPERYLACRVNPHNPLNPENSDGDPEHSDGVFLLFQPWESRRDFFTWTHLPLVVLALPLCQKSCLQLWPKTSTTSPKIPKTPSESSGLARRSVGILRVGPCEKIPSGFPGLKK